MTNQTISQVDTPDIKDCDKYNDFWISYDQRGKLTIGHGTDIGQNSFLTAELDNPPRLINRIAFTSWDAAADWSFRPGKAMASSS